ncbi:MAG: malonyl-CoA decarboxylase [Rhodocyclaceae bacterium]|nr:malonyl-CoA decarboxylase [Rhodocyclaceae bacterium]
MENVVKRSLKRIRKIVGGGGETLNARERNRVREQLNECAARVGGEVSARNRAARLGETYLKLGDGGRREFLRLIAMEFGPDPQAVATAHETWQAAIGTPAQWDAETGLRAAMRSRRIRILTQFNALPQGVKFLVDLRADLLRYLDDDPELAALDRELEARLTAWFDVGFLELRRITWNSPAVLLEKLIEYEAVHEIRSWTDLKNRLDSDRRCYAFFHPRMPMEPLIFVEVALTDHLADNIQVLLDEHAPVFDARRADTAIFYSISNTQAGLRGISFGNFLLKRVIDDLKRDFPKLRTFATLSPIPQLSGWVKRNPGVLAEVGIELDAAQLATGEWSKNRNTARHLREPLLRLAARYLAQAKSGSLPYEPVARFHLGNGARIERLNPLGDTSFKGFKQSYGLMMNYLYNPDEIEKNVESFVTEGTVAMSAGVRRLAKID